MVTKLLGTTIEDKLVDFEVYFAIRLLFIMGRTRSLFHIVTFSEIMG